MRFCTTCGNDLGETQDFCTACGTKVHLPIEDSEINEVEKGQGEIVDPVVVTVPPQTPTQDTVSLQQVPLQEVPVEQQVPVEEARPKKPMPLLRKILIGGVLVIAILLFGTYKYLEYYFDPLSEIAKMSEALEKDDVDGFLKHITFNDKALLDEESYVQFIKETQWEQTVLDEYEFAIEYWEKDTEEEVIYSTMSDELFILKQDDILFGLFKGYSLHAVSGELTVMSDFGETSLTLKELEIELDEGTEALVPIYPGEYEFTAEAENDYGSFETEDAIIVGTESEMTYNIEFPSQYLDVYVNSSRFDSAVLFVNGESTKETIADRSYIGPMPFAKKVEVHAEWTNSEDEVFVSNVVKVPGDTEDFEIYIEFDENEVDKDEIAEIQLEAAGDYVMRFRSAYENAVNNSDFSYIVDYLKPGSHVAKDLKPFVNSVDRYHWYDFLENSVTNTEKKEDNKFEVDTYERFIFHDETNKQYDYEREKRYFVELIGEEYQITKIDYIDTQKEKVN